MGINWEFVHALCSLIMRPLPTRNNSKIKYHANISSTMVSLKQYMMKVKTVKWGIKVFVLSYANNVYVYRLQVYIGKNLDISVSDEGLCT